MNADNPMSNNDNHLNADDIDTHTHMYCDLITIVFWYGTVLENRNIIYYFEIGDCYINNTIVIQSSFLFFIIHLPSN